MKIILVAVISINGKTTKGNDPNVHDWSSPEDRKYFSSLIKKSELVIMGRRTFLAAQPSLKLSPTVRRVVLTKNPARYKKFEVSKQLEFTSESPTSLTKRLGKIHQQGLLVGGAEINTAFLLANIVDEIWLTIEPKMFGCGKNLTSEMSHGSGMQLKSCKRLNKKGALLLKYSVLNGRA